MLLPWVYVIREYERAAVFRLGRFQGLRGPGVTYRLPMLEELRVIDVRTVTVDVPRQECISRDHVPMTVNAVVYYRVASPEAAIIAVRDFHKATLEIAQSTLRSVIGSSGLDRILSDRTAIADELKEIIDQATDEWGVQVSRVEIKDIEIPENLKRVMAKEAEAERERRAMVIRAKGEQEAASELARAAAILDASPSGFRIRYLQTLLDVAEEGNTVVFASPTDTTAALAAHVARRVTAREPSEHPQGPTVA